MSSNTETIARDVLNLVAEVTFLFREHAIQVRKMPQVQNSVVGLDFFTGNCGNMIAAYMEATLKDETTISWMLDVYWDKDEWTIETRRERYSKQGEETSVVLPTVKSVDYESFKSELVNSAKQLLALISPYLD